jgi:hypothetical protein
MGTEEVAVYGGEYGQAEGPGAAQATLARLLKWGRSAVLPCWFLFWRWVVLR